MNNFNETFGLVGANGMALNPNLQVQPAPMMGDFNLGTAPLQQNLIQQTYEFGAPSANIDAQGAQSMKVRKIYMGLTRPQLQQHRRSYDVFLDGGGLQKIQDKIDRHGSDAFNTRNISDVLATSNILRPTGQSEAEANIENGWSSDRYTFIIVADIYRNGNFMRTEYIKGYTDSDNIAAAGFGLEPVIDPNMVFSINHISEASIRHAGVNNAPIPMISATNTVMTNSKYASFSHTQENLFLMRPSDIMRGVDKIEMHRGMVEASKFGQNTGITYCDLDSTLTHIPMLSSDTNNLIPTFTSRILSGLYNTKLQPMDPMNMDGLGSGDMAAIRVQDTAFSKNGFSHIMNRVTGNHVTTTSRFSYKDLLSLDPSIDDRVSVFGRSYETGTISFPSATNTALMGATETIAVSGTMLSHTTLSLMAMAGITTLGFNANNHSGVASITWQACDGMDADGMLANRLENLRGRLTVECLNIISTDNELIYNIDVFADAINDIFIKIRIDNEYREYIFPAFGSAGTLPTVTNSLDRLADVSQSIDNVVKMLVDRNSDHSAQFGNNVFAVGSGETRIGGMSGNF